MTGTGNEFLSAQLAFFVESGASPGDKRHRACIDHARPDVGA
jgi:hypothetical protein